MGQKTANSALPLKEKSEICDGKILYELGQLWCPVIWSNNSLYVAVKVISVDVIDIINQLTLSERDHPEQSEWASNDKLKVLRAKTEFPGEKGTLPKNYRNLACVFNLLTCPKDSRFKATTSTPACWPTQ